MSRRHSALTFPQNCLLKHYIHVSHTNGFPRTQTALLTQPGGDRMECMVPATEWADQAAQPQSRSHPCIINTSWELARRSAPVPWFPDSQYHLCNLPGTGLIRNHENLCKKTKENIMHVPAGASAGTHVCRACLNNWWDRLAICMGAKVFPGREFTLARVDRWGGWGAWRVHVGGRAAAVSSSGGERH